MAQLVPLGRFAAHYLAKPSYRGGCNRFADIAWRPLDRFNWHRWKPDRLELEVVENFGAAVFVALVTVVMQSIYPDSAIAEAAAKAALGMINFLTLVVILRFSLFKESADPVDRILGSICGYLMIAKLWTAIYGIAMALDPMAIVVVGGEVAELRIRSAQNN